MLSMLLLFLIGPAATSAPGGAASDTVVVIHEWEVPWEVVILKTSWILLWIMTP